MAAEPRRREDARALAQHLAHLRVERSLSPATIASYRRDLTRYLDHLAAQGIALDAAGPDDGAAWMRAIRTGDDGGRPLAASSANRALAAVRSLHAFRSEESAGEQPDPAADVPAPARPLRLPHPLAIGDVEKLLAAAAAPRTGALAEERALRDRALLELLYGIGARISEVVGLDIDDVDRAGRSVLLRGKGDKHRVVPLGSYADAALGAYLTRGRPSLAARGRGTPAILLGSRGTRLTRQGAWQIVRAAAEAADLTEAVSPHTLRHSYATHLLQGGADVRSVQELLGHASVTTTQLYTQVTIDSLREAHASSHPRAVSEALSGAEPGGA